MLFHAVRREVFLDAVLLQAQTIARPKYMQPQTLAFLSKLRAVVCAGYYSFCRFPQTRFPQTRPNFALKVIGNQDDDQKGGEGRRKSVDVDQVAPSGDEVEDDFDEDDFEDP